MSEPAAIHEVATEDAGMRLDTFVADRAGCSRARARELLAGGFVRVDDSTQRAKDKGRRLESGARVQIEIEAVALDALVPNHDDSVDVLARADGWIAVDKPAGLAVHPLRSDERDTMLQRVAAIAPQIDGVGEGGRRSGVVHRLDVDTSGVQLFALDRSNWSRLRAAFSGHVVDKVYRAIVEGRLEDHGRIDLDLHVAAHRPARVRAQVVGSGPGEARRCGTRWRVLEHLDDATLIEARPSTGFLHQIRVSFAFMGHPLLGDAAYSDRQVRRASRHLLHASALRFEDVDAASPDPPDFASVLQSLRREG